MRMNLPVSNQEFDFPGKDMLVSTTDTKGVITHCNHGFVAVSGYTYDELLGQPHNLIRHPDMPSEAYKDMWSTIGHGRPWSGIVKNRRKNGDYYWVQANVTPIMKNGKPQGYMSVRTKPSREQIQEAEALYVRVRAQRENNHPTFSLRCGQVRYMGWRDWLGKLNRLTMTQRLTGLMTGMVGLGMLPSLLGMQGLTAQLAQLAVLLGGAAVVLSWFHLRIASVIDEAEQFASDLSGCNLTTSIEVHHGRPMSSLTRCLWQIQINMRAIIGDVKQEISGFTQTASEISSGSLELSSRTESQASSLQQTAASMEELSSTVRQTADTAARVSAQSDESTQTAARGGLAVQEVSRAMQNIDASSKKMQDIISVIEGIAFQTNILALNAAVEAARAGDQGRGFAVVASEVRALAQRSAVAAKEIRGLIAASAVEISQGNTQMAQAGCTIDEVVASVQVVGELIRQITRATQEQSLGISHVNDSVVQLDSVTQQNAALVEESAASAEHLSSSSATLTRSIQVFQLP